MPLKDAPQSNYAEKLGLLLDSKKVWHRFIKFKEPVRTVEQAAKRIQVEKIVKSIVMVDSTGNSLLAIIPAKSRVSYKKLKKLLAVHDVRLATAQEVVNYSGYPVGGVCPFSEIGRVFLDPQVLKNETAVVGGGDIDKLLEIRTEDIVAVVNLRIADIIEN